MRVRTLHWLTATALSSAVLPLMAQEGRGTLLGRVSDATGAVIVGAKVDATNTDTGVHYASLTSSTGDYILPSGRLGEREPQ